MQDQAFLGLEAALAIPDHDGARRRAAHRHAVAARGPQADRRLPRARRRTGCGSCSAASAARSAPARTSACRSTRACWRCALGRPVRMAYSRAESFLGHVHRHPATIWMRHHATRRRRDRQDRGPLRARRRRLRVDVVGRAAQRASPTRRARTAAPNAVVDGWAVRTNNLPCGAMRGFGVVQACFAHEGQMDKLAAACGLDPVEIRLRNAMEHRRPPDHRAGRRERGAGRALHPRDRRAADARRADRRPSTAIDPMRLPGGAGLHRRRRARPPRHRLGRGDQEPDVLRGLRRLLDGALPARRRRRHAEVRHVRGRARASSRSPSRSPAPCSASTTSCSSRSTPTIGSAGSTSASRQTWMSGGAVDAACRAVRERLFEHVGATARHRPAAPRRSTAPRSSTRLGDLRVAGRRRDAPACSSTRPSSTTTARPRSSTTTARATATRRSPSSPTAPSSTSTPSSGCVKVVQVATAQDVGRALNPLSRARPDRGRHRPGPRAGGDGGDRPDRRPRSATPASPTTCCRRSSTCPTWWRRWSRSPTRRRRSAPRGSGEPPCISVDAGDRRRHPRRAAPVTRTSERPASTVCRCARSDIVVSARRRALGAVG